MNSFEQADAFAPVLLSEALPILFAALRPLALDETFPRDMREDVCAGLGSGNFYWHWGFTLLVRTYLSVSTYDLTNEVVAIVEAKPFKRRILDLRTLLL